MMSRDLIRHIIREEVSRKYAKPTPKVEQLVYRWLNKYFDGVQMYHKKHYESTHTFEFCKNGKEILGVTLYFDTDYSVADDRRKTEERSLDRGIMSVPKNVFDDLTTDLPMRVSYLRYLFEEWFDDTYLGEIQKKMGRNDIYIDEFGVSNSDGDICFPPITKPDDVTEEEMIEDILKTGKYKMKDILWWEERLPGWIEQTYLEQLNGAEYRRLRGE
jgi:hypothetical protein